jgi:hypothetical protein
MKKDEQKESTLKYSTIITLKKMEMFPISKAEFARQTIQG